MLCFSPLSGKDLAKQLLPLHCLSRCICVNKIKKREKSPIWTCAANESTADIRCWTDLCRAIILPRLSDIETLSTQRLTSSLWKLSVRAQLDRPPTLCGYLPELHQPPCRLPPQAALRFLAALHMPHDLRGCRCWEPARG